jgi:hypothetical protein
LVAEDWGHVFQGSQQHNYRKRCRKCEKLEVSQFNEIFCMIGQNLHHGHNKQGGYQLRYRGEEEVEQRALYRKGICRIIIIVIIMG